MSKLKDFVYTHLVGKNTPADSYYLMRRLFCSGLGLIYLNAFLIYYHQAPGLYGRPGLLPYHEFIEQLKQQGASFVDVLSVFWFFSTDTSILVVGLVGISLSLVLIFGYANFFVLFALWCLHMSVIHMGQVFYGYGWETQLLELTFLSFFLFPFFDPRLNLVKSPPKKIAIYFQRWMMFRLMLGAGLIKMRGDECWQDLTCTFFHYETQPNPHPLSWYLHDLPDWLHKGEVFFNHFIELILPFALFGPKWLRRGAGVGMIVFQLSLISSGNLAWLNWITLLMAIPCFDDEFLARISRPFFSKTWIKKYLNIEAQKVNWLTTGTLLLFLAVGSYYSYAPALNLLSERQAMNTSYNRLHLINSYGAFGSVGRQRNEVIIRGTTDENISEFTAWQEYEFNCKPGNVNQVPCLITPYHYRLDWQIWFSAMRPELQELWLLRLGIGFLENNQAVLGLIAKNPFAENPPKYIKMDLYHYEFNNLGGDSWWQRRYLKPYLPPITLSDPVVQKHRVGTK